MNHFASLSDCVQLIFISAMNYLVHSRVEVPAMAFLDMLANMLHLTQILRPVHLYTQNAFFGCSRSGSLSLSHSLEGPWSGDSRKLYINILNFIPKSCLRRNKHESERETDEYNYTRLQHFRLGTTVIGVMIASSQEVEVVLWDSGATFYHDFFGEEGKIRQFPFENNTNEPATTMRTDEEEAKNV
jgi:hypothetical protein